MTTLQLTRRGTDSALVAVGGDGVVGLCSIRVIPLFAEGGALARLTSLVVATDARRRGIGRRLVEAAEAEPLVPDPRVRSPYGALPKGEGGSV